ncbi:MAG TPA: hypothetical protein VKA47_01670 [Solirubrobacterales bacterium]|nr:hypothetical protein [Solirubrobacterales bacterium]
MNLKKNFLIALGVGALAVPAAAIAKPGGSHGHGHEHGHGHGGNPAVSYVFKGTYGGGGVVAVERGNGHVKKADLVGQDVQFDLTDAKLTVADTNGDGSVTADDVVTGDRVVVKARLPKQDPGDQPLAAKQLVDQTNPGDDSGDED